MSRLAPEVQDLLTRFEALGLAPFETLTPAEARQTRKRAAAVTTAHGTDVAGVEDSLVEGPEGPTPIRTYSPGPDVPPGTMVYFHGGGWVFGDLDTHDALCRGLTSATGLRVVAVQYRLAPEHPYPAALEDAWTVTRHVAEREPGLLVVGGDSAGGNLATTVAARARGTATRVAAQLLVYPVTDLSAFDTPSYRDFARGHWLTAGAMEWFRGHYVPHGAALDDPELSPLHRADLSGMPPALVVTAECDVLRDEGAAYARRLRAAGNEVVYRCHEGMIHGFLALPGVIPQADRAIQETGRALRRLVGLGDGDPAAPGASDDGRAD